MRSLLFAVAALAATGGPAMSEPKPQNAWLTLAAPTAQSHVIFDGAVWRCEGDTCRSTQVKALPALRSCKRLARELGPVTAFGYRGVTLSDTELSACNPVQIAPAQIAPAQIAKTPSAAELAAAR